MSARADDTADVTSGRPAGVLSQGLISGLAQGVTTGAMFFAVIGMMRLLGEEPYGVFALAMQITVFSSMLADFGIGPVIMRRLAIEPGRSASILADAMLIRSILLAPTWVAAFVIGLWMEASWTFFLIINVMIFNAVISAKLPVLRGTLDALYRSQSRMGFPTVTMAVDSLMLLSAVLLLPDMFRDPLSAAILFTLCNLPGAVMMLTGSLRLVRRINLEPLRVSWISMRELLRESFPLALFLLFSALHIIVDSIYLKMYHDFGAVGVWGAALRILTPLAVFPTIIAISAAPYFARASVAGDERGARDTARLFSLSLKTLLVGAIMLAGFGALNARLLIELLFHDEFSASIVPMIILFGTFLPMSINIFLVEVNNARGKLLRNRKFAIILAVVSVAAGPLLISAWSAEGAAYSKLLAIVAGLAYLLTATRTGIPLRLKPIAWKAAVIALTLLSLRTGLDFLHPLLSNGVTLLAVTAEVFLLRFFTTDELGEWKSQLTTMLGRPQP